MNKQDIKRAIEKLEPDQELEYRLAANLTEPLQQRFSVKSLATIAAGLVLIISAGTFARFQFDHNTKTQPSLNYPLGSADRVLALLPDTPTKEKPQINNQVNKQNDSLVNALPPANSAGKSEVKNQADSAGPAIAQPSANQTPEKSEINTPNGNNGHLSALPPISAESPESEVISPKSDPNTDHAQDIPSKNELNLQAPSIFQNDSATNTTPQITSEIKNQTTGIYIPQAQLPENTKSSVKMKGLILYQGRIYLQNPLPLDPKQAAQLVGEKLGTTNGNITDWSNQVNTVELASTIGTQDVYTVKGYDKNFRIMTYTMINQEVNATFFECLNGITVTTGKDVFGKLNLEKNIKSAQYEDFNSWNNNQNDYKSLTKLDELNKFLAALESAIPYSQESSANLLDDPADQKILYLKLYDGSAVQLKLFKEGYVCYNDLNIFFKVTVPSFAALWAELS